MDLYNIFTSISFQSNLPWYVLVFLSSFLESLIIIGLFIPGSIFLVFIGFLLTEEFLNIPLIIFLAFLGAVLGDLISFLVGRKGTRFFKNENRFLKIARFEKGKIFFKKHGGKSIFLGRFTGPLRSITPFIAGTFKMSFKKFLFWNIFSAFSWVVFYLFIGLLFGRTWQLAEYWATRAQVLMSIFVLFLLFLYLLKQSLTKGEGKIILKAISTIFTLIKRRIENSFLARENNVFYNFLKARFRGKVFFGLPLTFLTVAFFYVLFLFFGFIRNFILSETIFATDKRIENLMYIFGDDWFIKFFYWVTLLGNWQVVISLGLILSIIFFLLRKKAYIFALWLAILGTQFFDTLGKIAFNRPRPITAIFLEKTTSFPSGHAAIAAAFYGFIAYALLRTREGRKKKINILIISTIIIFFIGFSRIYLRLHYLSDVIGGYLLGFLWLIIAISIFEWAVYKKIVNATFSLRLKRIIITLLLLEVVFYIGFGILYNKPVNPTFVSQQQVITASPFKYFENSNLPKYSETLRGNSQEPMSFLIIASKDSDLENLFLYANWFKADNLNRYTLLKIAKATIFNESYSTDPITPSFWNNIINEFAFQKATEKNIIKERHHIRFWKTDIFSVSKKRLYIGTASFDTDIKWFITHKIDPNIDKEREYIFLDLLKTGLIKDYKKIQFVAPTNGKNFSGDPFYTDGKTYLITL